MYAIVKTGGKQYRVEPGQRLLVERLAAKEGDVVSLQPLMYRSDDVVFGGGDLEKVTVSARVLSHERGEKLRVFKFKPKRGYRRRTGHRQDLTRIEVTEIALGGASAKAAGSKAAASKTAAARKPKAPAATESKPPAAESKPAAAESKPEATKQSKPAQESEPAAKTEKENGDGA